MMREILFRGKDIISGEWITGYLVDEKHIGCWVEADPVRPETVGQFTGLADRNGKQIFEGDILDADIGYLKRRGVVFYEESATRFGLKMSGGEEKNFSFLGQQMVKMYNVTVIGNIHDNPELLQEA